MLEVIGALAITIIAAYVILCLVGMGWIGLGFGGPSISNFAWLIGGIVISAGIAVGWWYLVGTHIHVGFG